MKTIKKKKKKKNSNIAKDIIQLIAVFDGHGTDGELTSNFATKDIPKRLSERLSSVMASSSSSSSVTSIPDTTVTEILKQVFIEVDKLDPSGGRGGCTATVVLQLGSKVFVANAGDSVSFVGVATSTSSNQKQKNKKKVDVEVIYQTREDKPDLPEERKRIHEAGGYVHIPEDPNHDVPRAYHIDEYGRARYGLAMSRSLGDWSVQGVIAEPIVDVIDLQQIQTSYLESCRLSSSSSKESNKQEKCDSMAPDSIRFFAVSMSDGMADYLEVDDVAQTLATSLFASSTSIDGEDDDDDHNTSPRNQHPLSAAESLIRKSAKIWDADYNGQYRDDIVVAAVTLPLLV
mmetsp:Transcript_38210/g.92928  ORF Transcript_38210/g.92928 Transcript_38210/m.92928 type:complete len:345 (-) Transcript_38210:60-1094(-)